MSSAKRFETASAQETPQSERDEAVKPEFAPTYITEVDIACALPRLASLESQSGLRYGSARVLVRLDSEPLGFLTVPLPREGVDQSELAGQIWSVLGDSILERVQSRGERSMDGIPVEGVAPERAGGYAGRREAAVRTGPLASVVVCTRDRADALRRCLEAVGKQKYPAYEIVVVDNAPTSNDAADVVSELQSSIPVRRVVEPMPGLSRARNRGLHEAKGSIVAFIDDDEIPDAYWLAELALGFDAGHAVGCVTGMIMTAALETKAQALFEEYGGHSKNRGFRGMIFDASVRGVQHPLYPLPPFGTGANMAFTRQALIEIGGFDPALGAGTHTHAAEDTAAFSDVMLQGYQLVYRPAALTWHYHRVHLSELRSQLFGYGVGLTSYFVRVLWRRPTAVVDLVALAPTGLKDLLAPSSQRFASMTEPFPRDLLAAHRRGMFWGLIAYPVTLWEQRCQMRRGIR